MNVYRDELASGWQLDSYESENAVYFLYLLQR